MASIAILFYFRVNDGSNKWDRPSKKLHNCTRWMAEAGNMSHFLAVPWDQKLEPYPNESELWVAKWYWTRKDDDMISQLETHVFWEWQPGSIGILRHSGWLLWQFPCAKTESCICRDTSLFKIAFYEDLCCQVILHNSTDCRISPLWIIMFLRISTNYKRTNAIIAIFVDMRQYNLRLSTTVEAFFSSAGSTSTTASQQHFGGFLWAVPLSSLCRNLARQNHHLLHKSVASW